MRKANQVWNWLPAFRAVAESEHLPTASRDMNLSASALSRSVRMLESDLETELFERVGRQLELTPNGQRLLAAVRTAMRRVESALEAVVSKEPIGPLHISVPGPLCSVFVLPALRRVQDEKPQLVPHISAVDSKDAPRMLLDGRLDIAVASDLDSDPALRVTKLGELSFSIYAGENHPLFGMMDATVEDALAFPFVGPPPSLRDHWPAHLTRTVGLVVSQMQLAVQVCASGDFLAILPDAIASAYRGEGALYRLPLDVVAPQPLHALTRTAAECSEPVEMVLRAIVQAVEDARRRGTPSYPPPMRSTMRPPAWSRSDPPPSVDSSETEEAKALAMLARTHLP
jgi:DNA-binding transcriptional LysR family regulator